jgi:hypothetical protein
MADHHANWWPIRMRILTFEDYAIDCPVSTHPYALEIITFSFKYDKHRMHNQLAWLLSGSYPQDLPCG